MNEIVKLYREHPVRIMEKDGEPWFMAKDVAAILGYSETAVMNRRLDDDEKTSLQILQDGSNYTTNVTYILRLPLYVSRELLAGLVEQYPMLTSAE